MRSTAGSHFGASLSYTELGPPDKMIPVGSSLRTSSSEVVHGRIAENTPCSLTRRAINCVYCPPKSSTTIPPCSAFSVGPGFRVCRARASVSPGSCAICPFPTFIPAALSILASTSVHHPEPVTPALRLEGSSSISATYPAVQSLFIPTESRGDSSPSSLHNHDVQQLIWHRHNFHNLLALQIRRHSRICLRQLHHLALRRPCRHPQPAPHLSIHLHHNFDFLFLGQLRVVGRPSCGPESARVPQHLPQLFGQVRRHRRQHQGQNLEHLSPNFRSHTVFGRIHSVRQFHHLRNRRIKVPAGLKILCHPPQRLVGFP